MVFDVQFFNKHQKKLVDFANSKVGRKILCIDGDKSSVGKNKIVEILPNAITWVVDEKKHLVATEFRTHNKFAKRLYYAFKPFWYLMHYFDLGIANTLNPNLNLGFDSLTAYPVSGSNSPVDGQVYRDLSNPGETFSNIVSGAGNGFSNTDVTTECNRITCSNTTNQFISIRRSIFCFDTSSIGGGLVSSAIMSLYGFSKANQLFGSPALDIVSATPAATNTLANSDYGNFGTTSFASIAYSSYSEVAYNDFALDSNGVNSVSNNNVTKFGSRINWDRTGTFSGTWVSLSSVRFDHYYADQTGTTNDPKLLVVYEKQNIFLTF